MCVTDTLDELEKMYKFAKVRLDAIYAYNHNRLYAEVERNDDWDYE